MPKEPLGWGLGITVGAALAIFLGGFIPSWGVALAPAAATAVFALGAYKVPEDDTLAWVLRVTVAFTIGFVAATVPVTLARIAQSGDAVFEAEGLLMVRGESEVRDKLTVMWVVMGSMTPAGVIMLALRKRRARAGDVGELTNDPE